MTCRYDLTFSNREPIPDPLFGHARRIFATTSVWVYAFSCRGSFGSRDATHLASVERLVSTVV
jgi:hypothetical protein